VLGFRITVIVTADNKLATHYYASEFFGCSCKYNQLPSTYVLKFRMGQPLFLATVCKDSSGLTAVG